MRTVTKLSKSTVECGSLVMNGYVILEGRPCKIVDMSKSRAGYGFKVHIVGIDIFRGKRLEAIEKSTCEMEVPVVEHKEYELITVENGFLKLMTKDGTIRDDVMLPDFGELGKEIQQASDEGKTMLITVQSTADEEAAIRMKEAPQE